MVLGGAGQYWAVLGLILESIIVRRFVLAFFCWEICSFSFILVWDSFIVGRFVVI